MTKSTKVAIIGAGAVGTATANCILTNGVASEIVLIDINKDKAMGEVLDMQHSTVFLNSSIKLKAGEYSDCSDCDIVILTASGKFNGVLDRMLLRDTTANILRKIVPAVVDSGFKGIFIVVSNPVDVMTQLVRDLSGFDSSRVIGTGTILETARFKFTLGQYMSVNLNSIDAYILGEHGDSLVIPWSHINVGGKNVLEIIADNKEKYTDFSKAKFYDVVKNAGHEVMKAKGNTQFGIASSVCALVTAILQDECKSYPVSAYLEGQYGIDGVYCGVAAIIGREGILDVGVYNLDDKELELFKNSAKVIKENYDSLNK